MIDAQANAQRIARLAEDVRRLQRENEELRHAAEELWTAVGALSVGFQQRAELFDVVLDVAGDSGVMPEFLAACEQRGLDPSLKTLRRHLVGSDVVQQCTGALRKASRYLQRGR